MSQYAALSIATALVTIALKSGAYLITGSVGMLSDALESGVNLAAALVSFIALRYSSRPPDSDHQYGHFKAEYFSSGFEGALILVAAAGIAFTGVQRLFEPQPLTELGVGTVVAVLASAANFATAQVLSRAGRRQRSIALEASAKHLMTDVWTTVAVIAGLVLVGLSGLLWIDALLALGISLHIALAGVGLLRRSMTGLLDSALPAADVAQIEQVLQRYTEQGLRFHAVRTRQSATWRFVSFHLLVPGRWSVGQGHRVAEEVEASIRAVLPSCTVFSHLEPLEDPLSWADQAIDRDGDAPPESAP